jgi:hypothetical protein
MKRMTWSDLTAAQKVGAVGLGAVQLGLLAAALVDLRRRPAEEIRGSKRVWTGVVFVNYIGPISYFVFGRKPRARSGPARIV